MHVITALFGVLFCLMMVSGRNFGDRSDVEGQQIDNIPHEDNIRRVRDGAVDTRHRKRRWQNYGYDYSPPANPFYENRMDYNRNQDLLPHILRQLDDILAQLKYQGQPIAPQPIYVPYPVPYPVPQYCNCPSAVPNITIHDRFKMDDENRIWGLEVKPVEEEGDGSRPISFNPIPPTRPISRPPPNVEHGSVQAGEASTAVPVFAPAPSQQASGRIPGMCNAAIISCCGLTNNQQQKRCFNNFGCNAIFSKGHACSKDLIAEALESFRVAYSPS